jgi:hypothetical protein
MPVLARMIRESVGLLLLGYLRQSGMTGNLLTRRL